MGSSGIPSQPRAMTSQQLSVAGGAPPLRRDGAVSGQFKGAAGGLVPPNSGPSDDRGHRGGDNSLRSRIGDRGGGGSSSGSYRDDDGRHGEDREGGRKRTMSGQLSKAFHQSFLVGS